MAEKIIHITFFDSRVLLYQHYVTLKISVNKGCSWMCLKICVQTFPKSDQNSNRSGYCMMTMYDSVGRTLLMTTLHPKASKDFFIFLRVQILHHVTSGCFFLLKRALCCVKFATDAEVKIFLSRRSSGKFFWSLSRHWQ